MQLEIARAALGLFLRDGYERVSVEAIADETGMSLRSFYRYCPSKEEVLSPILRDGTRNMVDSLASRPAHEPLAAAAQRAYAMVIEEDGGPGNISPFMGLLVTVPALRAHWLNDLRSLEEALVSVVHTRAHTALSDRDARLSAAAVVTALRVTLEEAGRAGTTHLLSEEFGATLTYLSQGAGLSATPAAQSPPSASAPAGTVTPMRLRSE